MNGMTKGKERGEDITLATNFISFLELQRLDMMKAEEGGNKASASKPNGKGAKLPREQKRVQTTRKEGLSPH